jgi:hypothetical protein
MGEEPRGRSPWPLVAAVLGVVALVVGGAVYVAHRVSSLPAEMAGETRAALKDLRSLAQAFRQGTVTTSFASSATKLLGTTYLQVATLRQDEVFERRDEATLFWGQLSLPDVVVEARAPVEYTYYLDLDKPWMFRAEGDDVRVTAPGIEFNTPAVDASAIRYVVREGSVLRDQGAAMDQLKQGLTALSRERARHNIPLVREVVRRRTEEFVATWLERHYFDAGHHRIVVSFADETPEMPRPKM